MPTAVTDQTVLYETKFSQLFELLAQQQDYRVGATFTQGNYRGSKGAQVVKQVGVVEVEQRTIRGEPITFADVPHDARWIYPQFFDRAILFDTWDELQTSADPRSTYARELMAAMNRKKDTVSLTALFADSKTGETGADTTSFDATNQEVAVDFESTGTNTYLTLGKIEKGVEILTANEVQIDMEDIYFSARAKDIRNLMKEIQVVNTQYGAGTGGRDGQPVLKDGRLVSVYGAKLVHSERHQTSGNNTWCGMWVPSGMQFGTWQDINTKITQREDLRGQPWQVYVSGFFGATRRQEKKVVRLLSITV